jgi:acyl-CoA thioester hydrolase
MMRLDRRRLENAAFREWIEIQTRFDDLDFQGHVNNVAIVAFLQEARAKFRNRGFTEMVGEGRHLVVGSLFVDYAAEMTYPEPVEIGTGVIEIGNSSVLLGQVARQKGRIVAFAEATLIYVENKVPTRFPERTRAFLEQTRIAAEQPRIS